MGLPANIVTIVTDNHGLGGREPVKSPENGGPGSSVMEFSTENTEDTEDTEKEQKKEFATDSHRLGMGS
jgi:hypothetical protein